MEGEPKPKENISEQELESLFSIKLGADDTREGILDLIKSGGSIRVLITGSCDIYLSAEIDHFEIADRNGIRDDFFVGGYASKDLDSIRFRNGGAFGDSFVKLFKEVPGLQERSDESPTAYEYKFNKIIRNKIADFLGLEKS